MNPSKFGEITLVVEGIAVPEDQDAANDICNQLSAALSEFGSRHSPVKIAQYRNWIGKLDITQELLADAQRKGSIKLNVSAFKKNSKGEPYIRVTANPYDDSWKTKGSAPAQQYQQPAQAPQQYAQAPQQYAQAPQQYAQAPQAPQAPAPAAPLPSDEIPF